MKKAIKIVASGFLALLVLLIGAGVWLTWFFDLNDFKPVIEGLIRAQVGLSVRLDGAIHHSVTHHLTLELDDVKVMEGGAVMARIDGLALSLALAPLLGGHVVVDSLGLDVAAADVVRDASGTVNRVRGDGQGRSRLKDVTLRAVSLRVKALTFRDAVEQIEWAIGDLALEVSALPLVADHRIVIASPSLVAAHQATGRIRVGELRRGDLVVHDLELGFENRRGEIRLSDVALELDWASGTQGNRVVVEGRGSTELRLLYGQTADPGPEPGLVGVQRLDVDAFEADIERLLIVQGAAQYALSKARVEIETLPLVLDGRSLGEIMAADVNRFLAEIDFRVGAAAASFQAPGLRLEDLDLTVANEGGALEVAIERLRAVVEPVEGVQPVALDLDLHGQVRLFPRIAAIEGARTGPVLPLEGLMVGQADLTVERLDLGLEGERYGARDARVVLERLPLIQDGRPLGGARAADWGERLGQARVELTAAAVETGGPTLTHVALRAAGDGRGVALEGLALELGGAPISGTGRLVLDSDSPSWQLAIRADDLDLGSVLRWTGTKAIDAEAKVKANVTLTGRGIAPSEVTIAQGNARSAHLAMAVDGSHYRVRGLRTDIRQLPLVGAGRVMDLRDPRTLRRLGGRTTLSLAAERVERDDLVLEELSIRAKGGGTRPRIEEFSVLVAGSRLSGDADLDFGNPSPTWRLRVAGDRLALDPLIDWLERPFKAVGEASLHAELEGQGLGHLGGGPSALPEQVTLLSGVLRAPGLTVTQEDKAYRITALEIEAKGTPLVADGRLLDPLDSRHRKAMLADTGMRLKAASVERGGQRIEHVSAGLRIAGDTVTVEEFGLRAGGSTLTGTFRLQPRPDPPTWALEIDGEHVPLGPAFAMLGADVDARGTFDIDAQLNARGLEKETWLATLTGSASIAARDVAFEGADLDAMLSALEATGRAGLLDVGALALGPVGPLLTRSLSVAGAAGTVERKGITQILQSRIAFEVDSGVMTFKDVAFATPRHRVAFTGGLNLATGELRDTKLSTLNERGCARHVEEIRGTLNKPKVSATRIVAKTLVSPVTAIVKGTATLLGPDCTPVYTGAVEPPASRSRRLIDRIGRD